MADKAAPILRPVGAAAVLSKVGGTVDRTVAGAGAPAHAATRGATRAADPPAIRRGAAGLAPEPAVSPLRRRFPRPPRRRRSRRRRRLRRRP